MPPLSPNLSNVTKGGLGGLRNYIYHTMSYYIILYYIILYYITCYVYLFNSRGMESSI